jgi:hypothetical protein
MSRSQLANVGALALATVLLIGALPKLFFFPGEVARLGAIGVDRKIGFLIGLLQVGVAAGFILPATRRVTALVATGAMLLVIFGPHLLAEAWRPVALPLLLLVGSAFLWWLLMPAAGEKGELP